MLAPRHGLLLLAAGLALGLARPGTEPDSLPACFPARFTVRGRWPGEPILRYRIEPPGGPLAPEVFEAAMVRAMNEWQATGCVRFEPAGARPEVVLAWATGEHGACLAFGVDPGVAHAGPVGPGTFVHFDAERAWDEESLRRAALHELGHVLGLGHSPDEGAVMHAQPGVERAHLAPSDRAALHSLYGSPYGGGAPGPGDLEIVGALTLRGVAPPECSAWTLLDTDGDGDEEIIVWRTDAEGHGARTSFHFAPGPLLERTVGPLYGLPPPRLHAPVGDLDGDGTPELVRRSATLQRGPGTAGLQPGPDSSSNRRAPAAQRAAAEARLEPGGPRGVTLRVQRAEHAPPR